NSGDRTGAAWFPARFALAVIDREGVLEVAKRAVGVDIVAQRGAARLDGIGDDGAYGRGEFFRALAHLAVCRRNGACRAPGRQAGAPQRLRHIYVAEASDQRLVEERGLERRL